LNIQGGGSRHLENHKNCDISATVGSIFTKFGMLAQNWPVNHPGHYKFFPFENVMWQTATILKIEKLLKIFRKFSFFKNRVRVNKDGNAVGPVAVDNQCQQYHTYRISLCSALPTSADNRALPAFVRYMPLLRRTCC